MKNRMIVVVLCISLFVSGRLYPADKTDKKTEKQNFTGWIGDPNVNVENQVGLVRLQLRGDLGTFQIFAVDKGGEAHPLLATYDENTSTFFVLKIGKSVCKLRNGMVKTRAGKTVQGAQLLYTIPNQASVVVDFSCFKSRTDHDEDMVKVTVTISNQGKRTDEFGLKAVFDTVLGETSDLHFSTAQQPVVNTEQQYWTMQKEQWVCSTDGINSIQFLLYGSDITAPAAVTLGNKDVIVNSAWMPVISQSRSYDNVLSYNNSAVAVNWEPSVIAPSEEKVIIFYLSVAADREKAPGELFLNPVSVGVQSAASTEAGLSGPVEVPAKVMPDVKFDVTSITDKQLDPAYIQALINRINALEVDDKSINRSELLRLNAELDAILEKLRQ
jgi:hypothetical protein